MAKGKGRKTFLAFSLQPSAFSLFMHTAFISIGSNIGERLENCKKAIAGLAEHEGIEIIKASSFYETEPWGDIEQEWFINCVVEIETELDARNLLALLLNIEKRMGRNRVKKGGPRAIDMDMLFFNGEIIKTDNLVVPHPFLEQRRFVLMPLSEIAPDFIHPVLKKSAADLLRQVDDNKRVVRCM